MTDPGIVRLVRDHFEGLFPKVCPTCGRRFATLRDYVVATERLHPAISYDAELGDWAPARPIGTVAQANCPCGNTLALSTDGMPLPHVHQALHWIRTETEQRRVAPEVVITWMRDEIRAQVLGESAPDGR